MSAKVEPHAAALLDHLAPAEQLATPGMARTASRMVKALEELTSGYAEEPGDILSTHFDGEEYDQIIALRAIPFVSLCEHHVLPFTGTVDIAYLPADRIVGLSKLPRVVRCLSRRLQVQERLTCQIADALHHALSARGVLVVVRGRHSCMALRGVESSGEMITSDVRGMFRESGVVRAEAFELLRLPS